MKNILLLKKREGETPLECMGRFRGSHKKYKEVKMTYAGRLDPMASGLLLVLTGEEVKNKEKYLKLDKVYEFKILFGFSTDTQDILGKVTSNRVAAVTTEEIKKQLKFFKGNYKQKLPLYSSKTWEKARAGEKVEVEEREVKIYKLEFLGLSKISSAKLLSGIKNRIVKVKGDFRQEEIIKTWESHLKNKKVSYIIGSFRVKCSSGTYVRAMASDMGGRLGIPTLAYSIRRTKIGK